MKFLTVFLLCFTLLGCSLTSNEKSATSTENQPVAAVAFEEEVHQLPTPMVSHGENNSSLTSGEHPPLDSIKIPTVDPKQLDDVWQRIRAQLSFEITAHPSVKKRIEWYLGHPEYMNVITDRAAPFLFYIVEEIEKRGLPLELALIPLFESDFDTAAYSSKHASGLWQLTPLIARHYGIKMGTWYDGRQDVIDATDAALSFLTYLHKRFDGNWNHALAAYNTGEGRVARAIAKNKRLGKSTDFFSLKLPKQTREYIPKLLAASYILKSGKMHFPKIANQARIAVLPLEKRVILDNQQTWKQLKILNPGYRRFPALLDGPDHIVVAKQSVEQWHHYLTQLPAIPGQQWQKYRIKRGDTLSGIAKRHKISVADIKTFNNLKSNRIKAGKTLTLPIEVDRHVDYVVKNGDSLWLIAKRFQVTVNKLKQWNNLTSNHLRIGDKLALFLSP